MSDPAAKARALQERALKRNEESREAAKQERAALWDRIKTEAPDLAVFMTELTKRMGKPAGVKIKFSSDLK